MKILGISAYYHDSAAAIISNGKVLYAAQEERFTRIKNDASFPEEAIKFCLNESGFDLGDIDAIAFYDKPFLKFERLLETYYAFAPKGFKSFVKAMPVWLKEKLFIKQIIRKRLRQIYKISKVSKIDIVFPEHHLSHIASAFYTSPFKKSAFITVDGVGEWTTTSYGIACGEKGIKIMGELQFPDSIGLFYSSFTYFLGFEVNKGEYKMMGLAPYSNAKSGRVIQFIDTIKEKLIDIKDDGSIKLNTDYFEYPVGLRMVNPKKWEKLFQFRKRKPQETLTQVHADLAFAVQKILEQVLVKMIIHVKQQTNADYLCLAGGVALNCVANSTLYHQKIFKDIYIQPAAGDAGGAIGAALSTNYLKSNLTFSGLHDPFNNYLGPNFSNLEIERVLRKNKCNFQYFESSEDLYKEIANYIAEKKVIGWFQGRTEFGPRALGNRSILADATDSDMQSKLNLKIKFRESFRPFAPAVCEEDYDIYFEQGKQSYYMLFTNELKRSLVKKLPNNFDELSLEEKRNLVKSKLPAITHTDFSARVQVVKKSMNPRFWNLLQAYKKLTGNGVLINTSFNVKDEPIVNTPENAYLCFMHTGMDILVLENYLIVK
ncbi:carbamoyltransferase family protein [Autumnicola psychrophila]|uniref:Carbamoyltransferase N-terminal domain-containing protein n=1 Tax=Autumnicola psychrophila TaxID=3075592 RepID=A0ABU3DVU8_9FLAO|nr:carbamoyltransferase N-terminal domain-containing protein [Zunongwangia sp. F225]MDT0687844.1 carbamoyltransferase N-terminal domain-containing protein [Zunongwangia sp. F225]